MRQTSRSEPSNHVRGGLYTGKFTEDLKMIYIKCITCYKFAFFLSDYHCFSNWTPFLMCDQLYER